MSERFSTEFVETRTTRGMEFNTQPSTGIEEEPARSAATTVKNRFSDHFIAPAQNNNNESATLVIAVADPTQTWERFEMDDRPTVLEGAAASASSPQVETQAGKEDRRQWDQFELGATSGQRKSSLNGAPNNTAVTHWTALGGGDSREASSDELAASEDDHNLPFRKTQSMRATANRKIQIVDALRQRRLSNTSLDREKSRPPLRLDEDELTRKLKIGREWQVFYKAARRGANWAPVTVSVKDGVLTIKPGTHSQPSAPQHAPTPADTLSTQDIRLCHNHRVTPPVTKHYDRRTKLHQIKLQHTSLQERRSLKRWFFLDHISISRTILKLGSPDLTVVANISDAVNEAIRVLPVTRDEGVAYRVNEVFVDVRDCSEILMNCDGTVLERQSLNRLYVQAFLSGTPSCMLQLNDVEALLLQGRGSHAASTMVSRQLKLNDVVLHPCVDKASYKATREIKFEPLDGFPFELLRCSIDPHVSPPLSVNAQMEYSELNSTVRMTTSFSVRKKLDLLLKPITDLVFKFPVPAGWAGLFVADTVLGRKSVRSTTALRGSFRHKVKSSACQITVHMGSAKYEPEHGAIMWRLGHYTRSSLPHTFSCDIRLQPGECRLFTLIPKLALFFTKRVVCFFVGFTHIIICAWMALVLDQWNFFCFLLCM